MKRADKSVVCCLLTDLFCTTVKTYTAHFQGSVFVSTPFDWHDFLSVALPVVRTLDLWAPADEETYCRGILSLYLYIFMFTRERGCLSHAVISLHIYILYVVFNRSPQPLHCDCRKGHQIIDDRLLMIHVQLCKQAKINVMLNRCAALIHTSQLLG